MKRFSLVTLLLVFTLIATSLSVLVLSQRIRRAKSELLALRNEVGYLGPVDADKINLVAVPTIEPTTWKWRVYVPTGTLLDVCMNTCSIPADGIPEANVSVTNVDFHTPEWGLLLMGKVTRTANGNVVAVLSWDGGSATTDSTEHQTNWASGNCVTQQLGKDDPVALGVSEPVVLLRRRMMVPDSATSESTPRGPAKGLMIWLEPK